MSVYFPNYTIAKNNLLGIGNLGFDSEDAFYNPKYNFLNQNEVAIFLSTNSLISSTSKLDINNKQVDLFNGKFITSPNISLQYTYYEYTFFIQYFNDLLLKNFAPISTWSKHFYTLNGERQYSAREPEFLIANQVFQIAISRKIIDDLSISIGLLTNFYQNKQTYGDLTEDISSDNFDNYQILGTINYNSNIFSLYLLYKSQVDPKRLGPEMIKLNDEIEYYNNSIVSFPGILGYGLQYQIWAPVKISLEMQHEFLNTKFNYEYNRAPYEVWDRSGEFSHNIFNNKIIFGINYTSPIDLEIGFLYSKYLKYDIDVDKRINYFPPLPKLDNINLYSLSFEYTYLKWLFNLAYQNSSAEYYRAEFSEGAAQSTNNNYQSLKVGLGYKF